MRFILCTVLMVLTLFSLPAFGVDPAPIGDAVTDQLAHTADHADTHSKEHGVQGLGGSSAFTLVLMTLGAIAMPSLVPNASQFRLPWLKSYTVSSLETVALVLSMIPTINSFVFYRTLDLPSSYFSPDWKLIFARLRIDSKN